MLVSPQASLTYKNSAGAEIFLAPFSTFWCEKCDEDFTNEIHSSKQVATHGKFFTGASMNERYIVLSGHVSPAMNIHTAQRTLQNIFNPTLSGILYFKNERMGIERDIECRITEMPKVYWSNKQLKFDISLIALDPFWKGKGITEYIALTLKKFKFPVAIPKTGMSFGSRTKQLESKFENAGNVESGFIVTFAARNGTVKNPEIRNETTGEKIKVNYDMQRYDVIVVTNSLQEKRIEINGVNGFKHLDAENSTFFKIAVGTNRIGYFADENINNLSVHVRYIPNYTHAEA